MQETESVENQWRANDGRKSRAVWIYFQHCRFYVSDDRK